MTFLNRSLVFPYVLKQNSQSHQLFAYLLRFHKNQKYGFDYASNFSITLITRFICSDVPVVIRKHEFNSV